MDRKHFIKLTGITCLAASAPTMFFGCSSVYHINIPVTSNNQLIVPKTEFVEIVKETEHLRRFIVVNAANLKFPIALYRTSENDFNALWMECTHKHCEVNPRDEILVCPCHGSEFTTSGNVTSGPAELDLKTFEVTTNNENVIIYLS